MEVPLCGHATLAAAHVLWRELGQGADTLVFATASGPLSVTREAEGLIAMDFPADPPEPVAIPEGLADALGVVPQSVWAGAYLVALLESEAQVRALTPDIAAIATLGHAARRGVGNLVVAAHAAPGGPHDVVSRFFAPGSGVAEDPATGSAHCILAPLFARLAGRTRLRFHQAYPGRGGDLDCEVRGERVILRGRAVTTVDSVLRVRPPSPPPGAPA
jgi:PhzF family phenazine biosynthesis protein